MSQQTIYMPGKRGAPKVPVPAAEDKDLRYWGDKLAAGLLQNPNKDYAANDRQRLFAIVEEMKKRGLQVPQNAEKFLSGGGKAAPAQQQAPQQSQALARPEATQLVVGTFSNADGATKALLEASSKYHLVSPATVVGRLPEGCEVVISLVQIDPNDPHLYEVGNEVGLDRAMLDRILAALGGSWVYSRRTDDGSHPHYCAWEAACKARLFDGQERTTIGNAELDTREDGNIRGARADEIRKKQSKEKKPDGDGGDKQLLELRKFLTRHAETEAMNRAIAKIAGIRRSYTREELTKAFAVARLMFTGHSEDPEARREFRQMIGNAFLGGSAQLYGAPQAPPQHVAAPQLQYPPPQPYHHQVMGTPPPALGTTGETVEDEEPYYDDEPAQEATATETKSDQSAPDPRQQAIPGTTSASQGKY